MPGFMLDPLGLLTGCWRERELMERLMARKRRRSAAKACRLERACCILPILAFVEATESSLTWPGCSPCTPCRALAMTMRDVTEARMEAASGRLARTLMITSTIKSAVCAAAAAAGLVCWLSRSPGTVAGIAVGLAGEELSCICRSVSMLWRWRRRRNDIDKCIRQVSGPQPRRQTREHAKDTNGHAPKGKNAPNKFG